VLRPDGIALHLLPNSNWRLLSLLAFYPAQAVDALRWVRRKSSAATASATGAGTSASRGLLAKALHRLVPHAHGSQGTALSELGRFSKASWDSYFQRSGWEVLEYSDNQVLASGDYLLGSLLPMPARRSLGRMTGGIAHVYVVRPKHQAPDL